MTLRVYSIMIFSCFALLGAKSRGDAVDVCTASVPPDLQAALEQHYPRFRLPRRSDYDERDIQYNVENGGNGCLGVATGGYVRNDSADYAVNLTVDLPVHTVVVVAHKSAATWQVEQLWDWGGTAVGQVFVSTIEPGEYERTEALDGPVTEQGELERYTSKRRGIEVGVIESRAAFFFLHGKKWVHVWVSD